MNSPASQGSSHRWSAPDVNAAAGAKKPPYAFYYSRYAASDGLVTCGRCHNPHDAVENSKQSRPSTKAESCLECHNDWNRNSTNNPESHAWLTHPVAVDYASFAGTPGYKAAVEPTGSLALVGGNMIYCGTCHGAHFVDSDSSTPDVIATTAPGPGDGHLLRSDGPRVIGATAAEQAQKRSNLCQACHTHQLHGTTNPIGCLDCHSGHSYNGGSPNYFVLRNTVGAVTGLNYTVLPGAWSDGVSGAGNDTGYCERCHGELTAMPGSTLRTHIEGENCRPCHVHNKTGAMSSFEASGCDGCHGYPPATDVALTGYALDIAKGYDYSADPAAKSESTTPHPSHSGNGSGYDFNCAMCHNANFANTHDKGSFQDVLVATGTFQSVVKPVGSGLNPTYTQTGNGSCASVGCHSNGGKRIDDGIRTYTTTTPAWQFAKGSIAACDACHGNDSTDMIGKNSDSHIKHLNKGYGCNVCHKDTAVSATALVGGAESVKHVNGIPDVAFAAGGTYAKVAGTCSVICHGANTPDWDLPATGACGTCHQYSNLGVATGTGPALGGAHAKHLYAANGGIQLACIVCHNNDGDSATGTDPDHVNGVFSMQADFQTTVCNPCHGAILGGIGNDCEPSWTNPTSVRCQTCHVGILAVIGGQTANAPTSGLHVGARISANPHDDSFNDGSAGTATCVTCHTTTPSTAHANGTFSDSSPIIILAANVGFLDGPIPTCGPAGTMASCHDDGGVWKRRWNASAGNGDGTECANCHGDFSSGFVTGMALRHQTPTSGDGDGEVAISHDGIDACYLCHGYKAGSTTTTYNFAVMHRNAKIEINTNVGWQDNGATVGCTGCHSSNNVQTLDEHHGFEATTSRWARALINGPVADCNSCHASNGMTHTGTNESETVHALHAGATGFVSGCTDCHSNAGNGVDHNNATVNFANKLANVDNYARAANFDGNCATGNGCHDSESGEWLSGDLGLDACADCHAASGLLGQGGYPPTSGKHTAHLDNNIKVPGDCSDCHGTNAAIGNHAGHKDGTKTVVGSGSQISAYAAAIGTCINTCHAVVDGRDWTSGTSLACADCHAAGSGMSLHQGGWPPVSNAHPAHIGSALNAAYGDTGNHSLVDRYEFGCGACHGSTAGAHMDGSTNVVGTGWNSAGKTCNTTYCHSGLNAGNVRAYATTPAWNAAFAGDPCGACHGNGPLSGAHAKHQVGFHFKAIYSGIKGLLPVTNGDPLPDGMITGANGRNQLRAHGGVLDSDGTPTSTTISCNICHNETVTGKGNDRNPLCGTCHNGSNAPLKGDAVIADMRKHVNGSVDIRFINEKIRSKAQVRDDLMDVPELGNNWTRMNLYKKNDGSSYDEQTDTLRALAEVQGGWNGIDKSCQISCHLWEGGRVDKYPAQWNGGASACSDCHTRLPK